MRSQLPAATAAPKARLPPSLRCSDGSEAAGGPCTSSEEGVLKQQEDGAVKVEVRGDSSGGGAAAAAAAGRPRARWCPEETAGWLSRLCFFFVGSLIRLGYRWVCGVVCAFLAGITV